MSRTKLPFDLQLDHLQVTAWPDPIVDSVGHDVRSTYVERFWLPLLGPSTTLLIRHIANELDAHPDGFDLSLESTAQSLGLGLRGGSSGPFFRALARTVQFGLTRATGPGAIAARPRIGSLTQHQMRRLPPALRAEHTAWTRAAEARPDDEERRRRARRLALSLLELGEPIEAAEVQLHRWKVHPALAHEALRWAAARVPPSAAPPQAPEPIGATPPLGSTPPLGRATPLGRSAPLGASTPIGAQRPAPGAARTGDAA